MLQEDLQENVPEAASTQESSDKIFLLNEELCIANEQVQELQMKLSDTEIMVRTLESEKQSKATSCKTDILKEELNQVCNI